MNQPMTYRCTKTVIDDKDDEVCFTEGRLYRGEVSATPAGEWAIAFTDDTGTQHTAGAAWLHQHFVADDDAEKYYFIIEKQSGQVLSRSRTIKDDDLGRLEYLEVTQTEYESLED